MTARYTKDHEWVRLDGNLAVCGITEHAQEQLGDVVFVELPTLGTEVSQGGDMAVVESVKAASEVYAPISGTIVEINEALVADPSLVNQSAEDQAWFCKIELASSGDVDELMTREAYEEYLSTLA